MASLLSRPDAEVWDTEPYGRYGDHSRLDGHDLITLLTWRFVQHPQNEGDPAPDHGVPERLRLSDEEVQEWHRIIERFDGQGRPYVTRREAIDPRATQVRTLVVNSPFPSQGRHAVAILKKVKWGALLAQILLAATASALDPGGAVQRVADIYGTLDVTFADLTHREAAVLTVAEQFKRAEWSQRWLWRCNDLLGKWSPTVDIKMSDYEFHDTLLRLINRGVEVEVQKEGERNPERLTTQTEDGFFHDHKVLIRPTIVLANW